MAWYLLYLWLLFAMVSPVLWCAWAVVLHIEDRQRKQIETKPEVRYLLPPARSLSAEDLWELEVE